jgi:predicted aconitase
LIPRFGEQVAWGESNAIAFVNSVIGARTNRYGDLMDICAAIIGRVPGFGLHLTRNRKAEIHVRLDGVGKEALENRAIYPLLGYLIGEIAGDRVAAVTGIPRDVGFDSLKAFSAAAASSGAVGLFHIAGVTPEAKTLAACLKGGKAGETHEITPGMLRDARERLWGARRDFADLVVTGCPHLSFAELGRLAGLIEGRRVDSGVAFWAFTSRAVYGWIETCGILKLLSDCGIQVFTDGCPLQYPKESWRFGAAMTDSAKFAHYCFSQTGHGAALGSLEECVESAVHGRMCRRDPVWGK